MEIAGETIAEFDASALRVDGRAFSRLKLSVVTDWRSLVSVQEFWDKAGDGSPAFHWPAVARQQTGTTLALHATGAGVEALMQLRDCVRVECDTSARGPLCYVAFLEVAPWNRRTAQPRRYLRLGTILIKAASAWSMERTTIGVVGLHASQGAEDFYRSLGFSDFYCLNEYKELYLELDAENAANLRTDGGTGP